VEAEALEGAEGGAEEHGGGPADGAAAMQVDQVDDDREEREGERDEEEGLEEAHEKSMNELEECIKIDTICGVAAKRPLPMIFFRSASGNEPVRTWLKQLLPEERKMIGEDLQVLQYRWPLGMPLVDSLGDGLWEVRSRLPTRIARTLFFVHHEEIILLHGFIKKTQKTPTEDRALALKRKHDYIQNS
jgi:phage-related protein